jgi:hypothetical protein
MFSKRSAVGVLTWGSSPEVLDVSHPAIYIMMLAPCQAPPTLETAVD